ncbi:MAG: hypothetical protein HEQ35_31705 [Gloeotrichia echinulata IR180]
MNLMIKADKTRHGASLQVILSAHNFGYGVACTGITDRPLPSQLSWDANAETRKNFSFQQYSRDLCFKLYGISTEFVAVKEKKSTLFSCKVNDKSKFLVEIGGHWECQGDAELNWQDGNEDINLWLKLYRFILGKCRYTSLELVVRSAALTPDHMTNFRTGNPVRVGSSENNKKQCHSLWQCQNQVGSEVNYT